MLLKHKSSCDERLNVFSDYVGRLGNEQEEHKELEQLTCKSDFAKETAMVKLAKEIDEPHDISQPTAECQLMTLCEKTGDTGMRPTRAVQSRRHR